MSPIRRRWLWPYSGLGLLLPLLSWSLFPAPAAAALLLEAPQHRGPSPSLGFLERRRWTWAQASEETKTEWAIVMRRYIMVDTALFELELHLGEALPVDPTTGTRRTAVDAEALAKASAKLAKIQSDLQRAVLDQNTSDETAGDMQATRAGNNLTAGEKRSLREAHQRERYGFFAVEASGQDVMQQADALLRALHVLAAREESGRSTSSWSSIVQPGVAAAAASTDADRARASKEGKGSDDSQAPALGLDALFQKYQDAARTFHGDLGRFEASQSSAFAASAAAAPPRGREA